MKRWIFLLAPVLGCSDGTGPQARDLELINPLLQIVAGNAQTDTVMKRLPNQLKVRVMDQGQAVPDVPVTFAVPDEGCGTPFAAVSTSDVQGDATNWWDLGTLAAECTMEARIIRDGEPLTLATFNATVFPGPLVGEFPSGWANIQTAPQTNLNFTNKEMKDQYDNQVHWHIVPPSFAHAVSADSTNDGSRILVIDRDGVGEAVIWYAGTMLCRAMLTAGGSPPDYHIVLETPRSKDGGCAGSL